MGKNHDSKNGIVVGYEKKLLHRTKGIYQRVNDIDTGFVCHSVDSLQQFKVKKYDVLDGLLNNVVGNSNDLASVEIIKRNARELAGIVDDIPDDIKNEDDIMNLESILLNEIVKQYDVGLGTPLLLLYKAVGFLETNNCATITIAENGSCLCGHDFIIDLERIKILFNNYYEKNSVLIVICYLQTVLYQHHDELVIFGFNRFIPKRDLGQADVIPFLLNGIKIIEQDVGDHILGGCSHYEIKAEIKKLVILEDIEDPEENIRAFALVAICNVIVKSRWREEYRRAIWVIQDLIKILNLRSQLYSSVEYISALDDLKYFLFFKLDCEVVSDIIAYYQIHSLLDVSFMPERLIGIE